ncbi:MULTISPECIES: DUF1015 family protein [Micromonospora]|uniref:DUF1015 family protein n=1 Tax=Micromonospora carbonacea TaxID=47853 RepID=A0A1C5AMJ7_9ACTN|nr:MULTISPECIES: DUF1015 family protein [Micromonospora]MBB5824789.1 uncharacterized protein (DUF1015 family) [Micromonospora carbonacea]QLD27061.1 DUF1015 family protein [Micromonospora carbonacea]WFE57603.1 DUF1015 family protein [Micromonospora sp. WMMD712]SCF46234.1 Uncharacterized conserved protein, DUF1015 family [Micromonospora carbonacea]
MTVVHPIARAWITTGGTGAQNYDEFADDAEITAIIEANPHSALGIEMPHRAPESLGRSFLDALPDAVTRLAEAKADGSYTPAEQVVVLYRISAPGEETAYGLFAMVDTDQISTSADEPGLVIRNEDVFIAKVRERVALAEALGHLLSPVLLLQTGRGDELHAALAAATETAGAPAATDTDQAGRTHAVWLLGPGPEQDALTALAGGGELVVADGNHRSLAAQTGGLPRFLAVVTTPASVAIQPYNRLVSELTVTPAELLDRLRAAGAEVEPLDGPVEVPTAGGTVALRLPDQGYAVRLPHVDGGRLENLDHALVERVLLRDALGLDPGDKRITYVGGDYPASWLTGEVEAGRAELAVLIAPVTVDDFVAVNLAREKMPRKSTWFTPKARGGLVVAELPR